MKTTVTNLINHVALVLDGSGSMRDKKSQVIKITDELVEQLVQKSNETDQETRISLYVFEDRNVIKCHTYDKDVLRMPSLEGLYKTVGGTPLIEATMTAIDELSQTAVLHGDHAFLVYVLTDGQENASGHRYSSTALSKLINGLAENWTLACFVPNNRDAESAKSYGFPKDNVQVWSTTAKGMKEVGESIARTVNSYYAMRSTGVRGSKSLFTMDVGGLSKAKVSQNLTGLHFGQFRMYDVDNDTPISDFVESKTKRAYKLGEGYYQLIKPEKVQPQKEVAIFDKKKSMLYIGPTARQLLGLPGHEVKVGPEAHPEFDIFIQSTSTNRKLLAGQKVVVLS